MARLNDAIEQAEKAQAEQQERITSVLTQEAASLEGKSPSPPKPVLVPLASAVADFADRVLRLAKRTTATTARIEL
jgi:hypothetical protein